MLEVLNHIHCVDYILDHVMEPLTQKYIRQIHSLLMDGTVDERQGRVRSGEYRTVTSRGRDRALLPAGQINSSLTELLKYYESQTETDLYDILDTVCHLCRLHQQTGFADGIRFGLRLTQELNNS